jgi:hypothetical protein
MLSVPTPSGPTVVTVSQHGLLPIIKLEGSSNCGLWRHIHDGTLDEDLCKCILREPKPVPEGEPLTPEIRKDQRCGSKICLIIQPHCVIHVSHATTAKQAQDSLKMVYQDSGLNHRLGLLTQQFHAVLINYPMTKAYVADFINISQELADISAPTEGEFLAVLMLRGLPKEYEPVKMVTENSGLKLTTELVKG